ncbi:5,10-methylenetetrahydromethanopterin reductase [Halostella litorea]|uniref:5,10-methylenetetrahydromethanopterin reductase n=1 Tax=Halostella litorea TaxID=2528831 RepID=UPI00109293C5|nr:5,10-methylenetetrahydromethanopterin reductase [Halostella litorea]
MIGIELTPEHSLDRVADLAARAEAAGFEAVLASCHYNNRDPFVALSRIAAATDDVAVGPAAANPYDTHPVKLASAVATVDEVSDGRGVFGVAAGDRSTLANLGYDSDRPLRRVLEAFKVAQRLWDGETVTHDGTFEATDAALNYDAGDIPVYVGAQGPHMVRMSAKHADGVLLNASHPDDFAWAAERVEEGLAERPADRGEFDFTAYASVSVAEDEAAAREAARPPVAFIAGGAAPPVLQRHGIDEELAGDIGASIEAGEFREAFAAVTPAMIDAFSVAGTEESVAERLAEILEYADGVVVGAPLGPELETAVSLAGAALDRATRG